MDFDRVRLISPEARYIPLYLTMPCYLA